MTTVCVPSQAARDRIQDLGVEVLVWDWRGEPPSGIERVEFLVPAYMGGSVPDAVVSTMSSLKVVQLLSAGFETWAPILPPGVRLCNGRGVHGASTAEIAVGGLINLVRDFPRLLDLQRARTWNDDRTDGLAGKRVLVLGAGDIGARVATVMTALDATATLVGRTAREGVRTLADVPDLLPEHDVVVIALPYSPETHHLVDATFLAAMPDGARLVNVARGALVDTEALLAELAARRLSAFLDVTDPEPLPPDHPLWLAPNVLISPHIGGGTTGWVDRGLTLVHEQLACFLAGQPLTNVVS
ncbi:MAG: 2-hydroxyacid dehydrogenase [Jatrophihabitantaceae bacterium]